MAPPLLGAVSLAHQRPPLLHPQTTSTVTEGEAREEGGVAHQGQVVGREASEAVSQLGIKTGEVLHCHKEFVLPQVVSSLQLLSAVTGGVRERCGVCS